MKTDEVIDRLAHGLKPTAASFYRATLLWWSAGTAELLGLFFCMMPLRGDLLHKWAAPSFDLETLFLLAIFVTSTWLAHRSSIPGLITRGEQWVGVALIVTFGVFIASKFSISSFATELGLEMNFYRGRCGPIVLVVASLQMMIGMLIARRAASTNLYRTGAWLGVSAGALALVAIQLICDHENFLHLLLWHAAPAALIVGVGSVVGRRFLRW
jgi:hypothetical protein